MRTNAVIDWLSYTFAWHDHALQSYRNFPDLHAIAHRLTNETGSWIEEKTLNGYSRVISKADRPGLRIMASPTNSNMGIHTSWSGSALTGRDAEAVNRKALHDAGRCSRIDVAIDIDYALDIRALHKAAKAGKCTTRVKKAPVLIDGDGLTLYIGSRSSEKYLRIYDKAAEQGRKEPWTRIELECKAGFARAVSNHVAVAGLKDVPALVRGFADWSKQADWVACMSSPPLSSALPKEEKSKDTQAWLLSSIAPALARQITTDAGFAARWAEKMRTLIPSIG
jgi:hypothetical protein